MPAMPASPDLPASAAPDRFRRSAPLDLPRQLMRRAGLVAAAVLLLAIVLGLVRMGEDIDDEVASAMSLASAMAQLGQLAQADDARALAALSALQVGPPLRHLSLQVSDGTGRPLLAAPADRAAPGALDGLLALHRRWLSPDDSRRVAWQVPRQGGGAWTVSLTASHDGERREAMGSLVGMLGLLLLCVAGLLAVMYWNVRHAFAPLGRLLQAIAGIEGRDARQVQALPTMPTRELESLAAALRHLGVALDQAEAQRRQLSQQVLTLQEEERARLARDLHDEFGQRLTALRVDAAWLARRLAGEPALLQVVDGMARQCSLVQQDIRSLLTRLQPFGPAGADAAQVESLGRGVALLQALADSWQGGGREPGLACRLHLGWQGTDGRPQPWPDGPAAEALGLPRALWLTLYRISQEALTNVARHAGARQATLQLVCRGDARPGAALQVAWSVCDDGIGVPGHDTVLPRGNGIAGIQQRVWAHAADLRMGPATPGAAQPGWRLEADFATRLLATSSCAAVDTAAAGR